MADLYEKKIEYLKDAKEESDNKLMRAERLLSEKERLSADFEEKYRMVSRIADEQIGETKLDLRMKTDEISRVTHLYEDNLMLVKELKIENEATK